MTLIWNLPSASGKQGESTILATRSAPRPLRRASLSREEEWSEVSFPTDGEET